jgi:serine/threonine-protein kinase
MEYLDGRTLADYLRENPRPPFDFLLDTIDQICLALDAAHAAGIVHRDLKPSNVWLQPDQRGGFHVKVLDFGIAKLASPQEADAESVATLLMTLPTLMLRFRALRAACRIC